MIISIPFSEATGAAAAFMRFAVANRFLWCTYVGTKINPIGIPDVVLIHIEEKRK